MAADDENTDIAELGTQLHLQWSDRYLYSSDVGEAMRINNILGAVNDLTQYQDSDGNAYFHPEFIARRFLGLTSDDISLNDKLKKKSATEPQEGGDDNGGGDDMGGGDDDMGGSPSSSDLKL